jgi:hypothetical protein
MQFVRRSLPIRICSSAEALDLRCLGYFRRPFTITTPEVEMTRLKYRSYPFLLAAVSVLASVGAGFRGT